MKTILTQCKYEIIRIMRNPYYVFWSLFMPIVFYVVFTKIFNSNIENQQEWQAHYLMSMTTFSVMGSAIMTLGIRLVEERTKGWSMFMRITPLSDSAYYFAKMVGQTVIHVLSIAVIFTAGALINGISLSAFEWLMSGLWILVASAPFLAIGVVIGTMKRVDTASGISNLIYMLLAISGGMWMPMEIMPKVIQNIGQWLPSYNFGNGAWQIIRGNAPEWSNIFILFGYLVVFVILSSYIRRKQEAAV
ncbi:ABC transporter permease [Robertmurraya andreesenii]|uniref:ABC-2 type transport system permease protein n=1 Tax=Anoxybacillus andreesenii TaxID=1325932 RepID=A0ABT9V5I1_9BACL|nr:ABC transporter permease [Robertmurraya andreesenii]MDQ0156201.1 ABC-2 type transport system permease protein [Robertmurraya andreesenii]